MTVAAALAVLALVLIGVGARLRLPSLAGAGVLALGLAEALVILLLHDTARALAGVPAAALLLLVGELGFDLADGAGGEAPGERRRQAGWIAGCGAAGAAIAVVVLGADSVGLRRSAVATIAGAAFAALVIWLLVTAVHALVGER